MASLLRMVGVELKRNLRCPFHDDRRASAEVRQAQSGRWYFYCHVCDISDDYWALKARIEGRDVVEVLKEINPVAVQPSPSFATFDQLFESWKTKKRPFKVEDVYQYTDPETQECTFTVVRYIPTEGEKKQFFQAHKNGNGWKAEAPKDKTPLFNRTRIRLSEKILIVEGEKCVKAFTKFRIENWAATTNPGGANGVGKADWSVLAGKSCYIWHDNDEAGLKHFNAVKDVLKSHDCLVYRIKIEELGLDVKEDVADYIDSIDGTREEKVAALEMVLSDAEQLNASAALEKRLTDIATGGFRHLSFNRMPILSHISKALLPGTVTTLCGEPGAGKSFLVLEQFWRWQLEQGIKVKILMLEEDDAFHQHRVLAQMEGSSDLADVDYCQLNPDRALDAFVKHRKAIDRVSRNLITVKQQMTLDEVGDWVVDQAMNSDAEILIVDPVTAAEATDKPWIHDQKYMFKVKAAMEQTKKRLLQTTHPRNGKAGAPGLAGMSGGAAYPRFSQTVLWLRNFEEEIDSRFYNGGMYETFSHKQSIEIRKARNGSGHGRNMGVRFNSETLQFEELGVMVND